MKKAEWFTIKSRWTLPLLLILLVEILFFISASKDPSEAELTQLDRYAERYRVDQVLRRIESIPYSAETGFSFVVWGDVRSNREVFERLWSEIQKEKAVFAVTTGDLVRTGTVQEWLDYFFPVLDRFRTVPFLPVVGNHDIGHSRAEYRRIFGLTDYAFDYGDSRFLITDNNDGFTPKQLRRLEDQLKSAGEKRKFVFAHKPPKTIEKWAYHSFSEGADAFCGLMSRYRVTTVFLGHIHAYSTTTFQGVPYVVTGGGGAGLHTRYGPMGDVHHYCVVHVAPDGMTHEVVRLNNQRLTRAPGGNEFYQHPMKLLSPSVLARVRSLSPTGDINDVRRFTANGQSGFDVLIEEPFESLEERMIEIKLSADGKILENRRELFQKELPPAVSALLKKEYARDSVNEILQIQMPEETWFQITLTNRQGEKRNLTVRPDGTLRREK
jgi:predicted phosphodiesterase